MTLDFALAGMFGVICILLLADLARGQHPERRVSVGRENAGPAPGSNHPPECMCRRAKKFFALPEQRN
jgi:hypothetical protein